MVIPNRDLQFILRLPLGKTAKLVLIEVLTHKIGFVVHRKSIMDTLDISSGGLDAAIAEVRPYGYLEPRKRGPDGRWLPGYVAAATRPQKMRSGERPSRPQEMRIDDPLTIPQKNVLGSRPQELGSLTDKGDVIDEGDHFPTASSDVSAGSSQRNERLTQPSRPEPQTISPSSQDGESNVEIIETGPDSYATPQPCSEPQPFEHDAGYWNAVAADIGSRGHGGEIQDTGTRPDLSVAITEAEFDAIWGACRDAERRGIGQ